MDEHTGTHHANMAISLRLRGGHAEKKFLYLIRSTSAVKALRAPMTMRKAYAYRCVSNARATETQQDSRERKTRDGF